MQISAYEIILPLIGSDDRTIEGKSLLVNGLYGALDVVETKVAKELENGDFEEIPFSLLESLATRGHITRKNKDEELADAKLLGRIWNKIVGQSGVGPVILPTYDCNFRCPYCFERHRLSRGAEWLGHAMKPEMVDSVFAALQKQRDKGYKIRNLSLYGGEPLLRENKETVRNICEHAKKMGLQISATTNGYDLDEYIDLLEAYSFISLQITVDGVREQNDCRRLHKDGLPTYERILQNTALALDHGINVNLRVNVNGDNIHGIKALIDDLNARRLHEHKGKFRFYFKAVSEDIDSPTRVTEQQVMDEILAAGVPPLEAIEMQSQYSMPASAMKTAMEKKGYPNFSPAFCGAMEGMLCIAPDGLLYSCWDLVAMEENAVGFTDPQNDRFIFNFDKAKWRTRTTDLMDPCKECPYLFICRGGCAPEAFKRYGSYFRENCGESKEIFAFFAPRIAGKKWEETNESELTVSLAGPLSRLTESERSILMRSISQREILEIVKKAGLFPSTQKDGTVGWENFKGC